MPYNMKYINDNINQYIVCSTGKLWKLSGLKNWAKHGHFSVRVSYLLYILEDLLYKKTLILQDF